MLWIRLWLSLMLSTTVLLLHKNHQNWSRTLSSSDEDFSATNALEKEVSINEEVAAITSVLQEIADDKKDKVEKKIFNTL